MRRTVTVVVGAAVTVLALAGCGSDGGSDGGGTDRPATATMGEAIDLGDGRTFTVVGAAAGGSGAQRTVEVTVRFENGSDEEAPSPELNVLCAGDAAADHLPAYAEESTYVPTRMVPAGEASAGVLGVLPSNDLGETCAAPATITVTPVAGEDAISVPVPDSVVDDLTAP